MENREDILDALTAFGKNQNQQEIPPILERYLNRVAKNGETLFPWAQLKPLIVGKMEKVIQELKQGLEAENIPARPNVENVRFDVIHARIMDALHRFNGAPFTIQRLCELLTEPKRHYKRSDKFMRGLEKNVLVVSTVDPFGRKVVCESSSKHMVNGMDVNGTFPPRDTALTVPLPPVPGWVTTTCAATSSRTQAPPSESISDQRLSSPTTTQAPGIVSNGIMSGGLASSVYTDQGEQLAVQTEEVIEETVVTMETNDVSSVPADAGEALAEGEEFEDIADDRTSSSSSSSSSSEELSTSSDSIDSNIQGSSSMAATSSSMELGLNDQRPWAAIAQDGEDKSEAQGMETPSSCQTENQDQSENASKDNPCSPPTSTTMSSSSHIDAVPTPFPPESTSMSGNVAQTEVDSQHPLPESSLADSPQSTQTTARLDTAFPTSDNTTSLPNDSISTSVPDSLQNTEQPCTDDSLSDRLSDQNKNPATSLNQDLQSLSSSSDTTVENIAIMASTCDRLVESEPFVGSAEPAVSSSSSNCTSSSTDPTSPVTESPEIMPDSAESVVVSDNDTDSEPARKRLRLTNDDEDAMERDSSPDAGKTTDSDETTTSESIGSSSMELVHSSAEVDGFASTEAVAASPVESGIDEDNTECESKSEDKPENESQGKEVPIDRVEDVSKASSSCSDQSEEAEAVEAAPTPVIADDESGEDAVNVG